MSYDVQVQVLSRAPKLILRLFISVAKGSFQIKEGVLSSFIYRFKHSFRSITYTIKSGVLGEHGKEVVLNKKTDMPAKKYLYRLSTGIYKATTSFKKIESFLCLHSYIRC